MSEAERDVSSDEGVVSSYESRSSYERAYIFAAGKLGTPGDAVGCAPAARAAPRAPHGAPIHCKLRHQTCSRPTRARGAAPLEGAHSAPRAEADAAVSISLNLER